MPGSFKVTPVVSDESIIVEFMIVMGTRPEAIKMLPLVRALEDHPRFRPFVVTTGQHPGVVESILAKDGLKVDVDLGLGRPGRKLNELLGAVVTGVEGALEQFRGPSLSHVNERGLAEYTAGCLVHGDTTSAAAGALAAFHMHIPVGHVEAGLRTRSTLAPFPEELNRQLIARIASFHLAPTRGNAQNLVREGIDVQRIYICGNTGIDALMWAAERREPYGAPELADLEDDDARRVVTVTAHRRENWGPGLERIAEGVRRLSGDFPDVRFVLPLHPNRRVADLVRTGLTGLENVSLIQAMEYIPFARLLARSTLVITDSGGIQEEAPALDVPVLVTRETTERVEGLEAGTLELVGTDPDRIVAAATRLLNDERHRAMIASRQNPYGDGRTAQRIIAALAHLVLGEPAPQTFGPGFYRDAVLDWAGYERVLPEEVTAEPPPTREIDERDPNPIEGIVTR